MKKRFFTLCALILASFTFMLGGINGTYAKFQDEIVEVEPDNCFVHVSGDDHVEITCDKESGHVGDECTLTLNVDSLYVVKSVSLNGNLVNKDNDGKYKFILSEGDNNITVETEKHPFLVALEGELAKKTGIQDFSDLFAPENIFKLLAFVADIAFGIAFLIMYIKGKKVKTTDRTTIVDTIKNSLPEEAEKIIKKIIEDNFANYFNNISTECSDVKNAVQTFVQAFLYNLEGTPESKQQVIKLLSSIKITDEKTVADVTKFFEEKIAAMEKDFEEKMKLLEGLKSANDEALEKANIKKDEPVKEDDNYDGTNI